VKKEAPKEAANKKEEKRIFFVYFVSALKQISAIAL
jgi:hypothetical protein